MKDIKGEFEKLLNKEFEIIYGSKDDYIVGKIKRLIENWIILYRKGKEVFVAFYPTQFWKK